MPGMDDLNALEPPSPGWFARNRPPPPPQDVMHTQSIQGGFRHIKEDCVYIHQQIDDVLRDPNLDMLRQAAKRIEFTLRRMKWDFEHLTGLYDDMKRKVAELEKALAEAKAAAAASTDTETDVSVIGTDKGTEAATVVGSDVGSDDTTDVATEGDSDGIETPTGSESPSDVDSVIDDDIEDFFRV